MSGENKKVRSRKQKPSKLLHWLNTEGRRYCAVALCASLIAGNLPYIAIAGDENPDYRFELDRQELCDAVKEAIASGEPFEETLHFRGDAAEYYEDVMANTLYELTPYIWDEEEATPSDTDQNDKLELRIFACPSNELVNDLATDSDASDWIESEDESDGTEAIYFMLVNKTNKEQTAVIQVGEKETELITVAPYNKVEMENTIPSTSYQDDSEDENVVIQIEQEETEASDSLESEIEIEDETEADVEEDAVEVDDADDAEEVAAVISYHDVYRVASAVVSEETATPSDAVEVVICDDATASNATDSNAEKDTLDGDLFEAVQLDKYSAVIFATTFADVGITVDGHLLECEDGCSGQDCECNCHAAAHGFIKQLDDMLAEAKTYDTTTTTETFQALYDKLTGYEPGAFSYEVEAAYGRGELTEAENSYVNAAYDEKGPEIVALMQALGFDPYGLMPLAINTVEADEAPGVTVRMFNYDSTINDTGTNQLASAFGFWNGQYASSVDGVVGYSRGNYRNQMVMQKTLRNGYPYVEKLGTGYGSMDYLFNPSSSNKYYKGTGVNGGGLFQKDGSYYYYDSALNAAWFNEATESFTLYDKTVRPSYITSTSDERYNFLPFNKLDSTTATEDADGKQAVLQKETITTTREWVDRYWDWNTMQWIEEHYEDVPKTEITSTPVDLWFGMNVEFEFMMPKDGLVDNGQMLFDFIGDDDVFVYIDDILVLDIGGVHGELSGSINFATGIAKDPGGSTGGTANYPNQRTRTLRDIYKAAGKTEAELSQIFKDGSSQFKDYTLHTLKFYYLERGGNVSHCRLKFNMPTIPEKSLVVQKELTSTEGQYIDTELKDFLKDTLEYKFRVLQADRNGVKLSGENPVLLITEGESFVIREGSTSAGQGTVGADGYFTLKAGQSASFENMLEKARDAGCEYYIVEESLPDNVAGQYGSVEYTVSSAGGVSESEETEKEEFSAVRTGSLIAENTQYVLYKNKVDVSELSVLKVTKEQTPGSFLKGQTFKVQVKLGDELLPKGTPYQVNNGTTTETKTVQEAGILELKVGDTAKILSGIVAGTKYEILEIVPTGASYRVNGYSGNVEILDGSSDDKPGTCVVAEDQSKVTGEFTPGDLIHVKVVNTDYDFGADVELEKTTIGFFDTENRTFTFEVIECDEDGNDLSSAVSYEGTTITVKGDGTKTEKITFGYKSTDDPGTHYYKISEKNDGSKNIIFDDTEYMVKVETTADKEASVTGIYVKGDGEWKTTEKISFTNAGSANATVKKLVSGNMGILEKEFTFTATLTDDAGNPVNAFTVDDKPTNTITFKLKHDGTKTLEKLPAGATLTVKEVDSDGYTVTYHVDDGGDTAGDEAQTEISLKDGHNFVFTNTKNVDVDTGILLDSMPYVVILAAVAAGAAFYFIRKKKEDEDDFE